MGSLGRFGTYNFTPRPLATPAGKHTAGCQAGVRQLPAVHRLPTARQLPAVRRLPVVRCPVVPQCCNCHTGFALTPWASQPSCLVVVLCSTAHCISPPFTLVCNFLGLCDCQVHRRVLIERYLPVIVPAPVVLGQLCAPS